MYDGGVNPFSTTSLDSVAQAVVSVLGLYEETKNKYVYVRDMDISQKQLLAIAQKVAPEKKFEPVTVSTAEIEKRSNESLARGEVTVEAIYGYLSRSIFAGPEYGCVFEKDDNALLGITGKTEADVEAIFKALFASRG